MQETVIRPVRAEEHAIVLRLLAAANLPVEGLENCWDSTLVAATTRTVVGSAALELHGADAVLRSVCVDAARRGEQLGRRLVAASLELARQHRVRRVYLLTETAPGFFQRLGFDVVERATAPAAVRESIEFSTLCPAGAIALALRLSRD